MTVAIVVALPLLLAAGALIGGRAGVAAWGATPWAPLALLLPLAARESVAWSWSLLGLGLGVDDLTAPFVLLTVIAWSLAGWFARSTIAARERTFWVGWSLSLAGMTLLLLALTLTTFYLGYVVLSLSAYLMIVHARDAAALRAGRIYLIMALAGEAAILSGVLLVAGGHASIDVALATLAQPNPVAVPGVATALLLVGFAVKLGIVPLHVWLPLAHPIAPVPASAILSGVIVKAGLLGWLRLAPPQGLEPSAVGAVLLVAGFATAFAGVLLGLTQRKLKTVLAYSTVSQMGLVLAAFSTLYLAPAEWPRVVPVIGLIALHHGLNKAALFLACGNAPGATRRRRLLLALPALSLAAAPLTTGYLAKEWLKRGIVATEALAGADVLLALTSAATALLMWRVWRLATGERHTVTAAHPAWALLTVAALTVPWAWAASTGLLVVPSTTTAWAAAWPLLLAGGIVLATVRLQLRGLVLPEGDVVVLVERLLGGVRGRGWRAPGVERPRARRLGPRPAALVASLERRLAEVSIAGLTMLVVGGLLWLALWLW
jgi:formate hydrogenlyase subunit 3/multisubunit Na+/H+ antiporter MnhD subunit